MLHLRPFLTRLLLCFLALTIATGAQAASTDDERVHSVVARFLKDYFNDGYAPYFLESLLVTPAAKASLRRLDAAAKKKDPKVGLDRDLVAQGKVHAAEYSVENIIVTGDKATAEGVAEGFPKIALRLVRNKSGWLIDGAGEINPAPAKPARR
jgi:hypothetical protein